ncbi:hypothetical protein NBRC116583_12960 [Arenicella sp. 4NH20-0111]|uniref:hypothetical protein n=1 Tax=Arenicella sp. 4NH20-0111 TaxID=3127648 RepID=UPI003103D565
MSDDKSNPKLSLEKMLKDLKPGDYKTENEDREWLDSSVGKEILGPDKKESVIKGHE